MTARSALILATVVTAALPAPGRAITLVCGVATICEGQRCHMSEAGMNLSVLIERAESGRPVLVSDSGAVAVRARTGGGQVRFEGVNGMGTRETLVTGPAGGRFDYLRRGRSGPSGDLSYNGTCQVTR